MKVSLNAKLVVSFVLVVVTTGLVAMVVGVYVVGNRVLQQAQDKVRMDLNSAREVYQEHINSISATVRLTANRFFLKEYLITGRTEGVETELAEIRNKESLDVLTLTDANGRVLVRARNPVSRGDRQADDKLVSQVLETEKLVAGSQIVTREELTKEGEDFARQAHIEFIPTPKAKPRPEKEETSGMMIKAAAPILDYDGNLIGVLYGGKLLNRDYEIVDKIKDMLYRGHTYKGKDIGTATIFLRDLRISTNVRRSDGERATGTRVSEEVYEHVLEKGQSWIHRAFVVNDWYITAYEPIKDFAGQIIGILYVGILEQEFTDMRRETLLLFLSIAFAGMVIAIAISWFLARGIVKPIKHLVSASGRLAEGDLDYRVAIKSKDEIGELGETFNLMAHSIQESNRKLREQTQKKLMDSEKLATIGRLAAGVAHEINNPLTAVMTFSHLLLEDTPENDRKREDIHLIITETTRCRDIVKKLLDFSRARSPEKALASVNSIIERTLSILRTQSLFQNIQITEHLSEDLPDITIDPDQIQQVITNMLINGAEAMPDGGKLTISTDLVQDGAFIQLKISDTGCGISEPDTSKLFDPFYTTKEMGTGLGLSVSYGIVRAHDGSIGVESTEGKGTTFVVQLPVRTVFDKKPDESELSGADEV